MLAQLHLKIWNLPTSSHSNAAVELAVTLASPRMLDVKEAMLELAQTGLGSEAQEKTLEAPSVLVKTAS